MVVAIIQISTLNTEVDKGSKTTAFDLGLVAPKGQGNFRLIVGGRKAEPNSGLQWLERELG